MFSESGDLLPDRRDAQRSSRTGRVLGDNPLVLASIVLLLIVGIGVVVLPLKRVAEPISPAATQLIDLDDQGTLHRG
jgi:hypothetical protein